MKKLATITLLTACLFGVFGGTNAQAIGTWPTPEQPLAVNRTVNPQSTVAIDTVPLPESPSYWYGSYFTVLYYVTLMYVR